MSELRAYLPDECGDDGYPRAWHESIKHAVREAAGHRCVRCGHPFIVGESGHMEGPSAEPKAFAAELGVSVEVLDSVLERFAGETAADDGRVLAMAPRVNWSRCDYRCTHGGPVRARSWSGDGAWRYHDDADVPRLVNDEADEVEAAWRILTVHHLDGDKRNCRWWNLAALCQRCHLTVQGKVVMDRRWHHEHSPWFRPYVAGYYAHTYLREELTRAEAVERMDELLALEIRQEALL